MSRVSWQELGRAGLSLGIGLAGAGLFTLIGFPVAPLTGAAFAVSMAALLGVRMILPKALALVAFVLVGINIGTGVTPAALGAAVTWPLSLAVLGFFLLLGMLVTQVGLQRFLGFLPQDAVLAGAPGHLTYVLTLSLETGGDPGRVAVIQSIRVLFLTLVVPVIVASVFGASGTHVLPPEAMSFGMLAGMAAAAVGVGLVFKRMRLPAAFLLAGMAVSAVGHAIDLTPGRLPPVLSVASFVVMGTMIGTRFSGQTWNTLRVGLAAGVFVTGVNVVMTLLAVGAAMVLLGLTPAMLVVGYTPGGVEAMAAMALALGLDPAFVAAHHVARLLMLTVLVPALLARAGRQKP
ncbi:AbrB family transcriptional regulator [Vannielia sp.]|uniref:AbrB family transcriptional regulator n=1 Tax=Vannielia sp. TaxID=2813045 RepID=UPI00262EFD84|nr:AbrB family transcriptional regulator [Vannielia sp.]MDF1872858.1 AbrB family transcriptional regulator [Vannielia sp.]